MLCRRPAERPLAGRALPGTTHEETPIGSTRSTVLAAWNDALVAAVGRLGGDTDGLAPRPEDPSDANEAGAAGAAAERVDATATYRLWIDAAERTDEPALGLHVARFTRPGTFHVLGSSVVASATLRDALVRIERYAAVTSDAVVIDFDAAAEPPTISVRWQPNLTGTPETVDAIFSTIVRTARFLVDPGLSPLSVALQRTAPDDPSPWLRHFRCPVAFDAAVDAMAFDRRQLDRPVMGGDAALADRQDALADDYLDRLRADGPLGEVRDALARRLVAGPPTLTDVAHDLGVSPRSLQRRLTEHDTTYRAELDIVRRHLAEQLLAERGRTVTEVAYLLGYAETTSFARAHRRWTGRAPTERP